MNQPHIYIYSLPFGLPSHSGHHCVLSRVRCILQYVLIETESENRSLVSNFLWPHGLYNPWNSPGQNTGVSSLSFLQGIFPTQGSNSCLPHCRWILSRLSYQGRSHQLSILHTVSIVYMCQSQSPNSSHSHQGHWNTCMKRSLWCHWQSFSLTYVWRVTFPCQKDFSSKIHSSLSNLPSQPPPVCASPSPPQSESSLLWVGGPWAGPLMNYWCAVKC